MAWERVTIHLSHEHLLQASFDVRRGRVHDFKVILEKVLPDGTTDWVVRYETHGGRAHKHERWGDEGQGRHKHPASWRGSHPHLMDQAIEDLKQRFEEYDRRYERWKRSSEK